MDRILVRLIQHRIMLLQQFFQLEAHRLRIVLRLHQLPTLLVLFCMNLRITLHTLYLLLRQARRLLDANLRFLLRVRAAIGRLRTRARCVSKETKAGMERIAMTEKPSCKWANFR